MKILAFADMHSDKMALKMILKASKEVDLIICAGDISWFGNDLSKILREFNQLKKPFFLVPGNHEDGIPLQNECEKYKNIHYMHKAMYELNKYTFLFYGKNGFSTNDKYAKEFFEKAMKEVKKDQNLIFVSHGPPANTKLDDINGQSVGDKALRSAIEKFNPMLFICGHIHENLGKHQVLGKTLLISPGPTGKILEI